MAENSGRPESGRTGSSKLYSIEYESSEHESIPTVDQTVLDLYRYFSMGNIVAFVGSGASMSLGHCSWGELAEGFAMEVVAALLAESRFVNNDANRDVFDAFDKERSKASLETVVKNIPESGRDCVFVEIASEVIQALCAKQSQNIDNFEIIGIANNAHKKAVSSEVATEEQKSKINKKVGDHWKENFRLRSSVKIEKEISDELKRWIEGTRGSGREIVSAMVEAIDANRRPSRPKRPEEDRERDIYLPPDYRRGVELLFDSLSTGWILNNPKDQQSESDLIKSPRPSIDLFGLMRNDWNIARYATLNFDHEIERMLEWGDYPYYSLVPRDSNIGRATDKNKSNDPAQSRLGEKARSVDLTDENIGELMLFAADCPAGSTQVLHLHGSVENPNNMIVTDGDYGRRYFTSSSSSDLLSDGQHLFFRSNTIVFFGVGMSEDELLRAARVLAQDPERIRRPAYAFMPSLGVAKDNAIRIKLYQRYGIHTLFYGTRLSPSRSVEISDYGSHRLLRDIGNFMSKRGNKSQQVDTGKIAALPDEIAFLKTFQSLLEGKLAQPEKKKTEDRIELIVSNYGKWDEETLYLYPRLLLTPWHRDVFCLACWTAHANPSIDEAKKNLLSRALNSLESAIQSRALEDAMCIFSEKATAWRARWKFPYDFAPEKRGAYYREDSNDNHGPLWRHDVSISHSTPGYGRRTLSRYLMECCLHDPKGQDYFKRILRGLYDRNEIHPDFLAASATTPLSISAAAEAGDGNSSDDSLNPTTSPQPPVQALVARTKIGCGKGIVATHFCDGNYLVEQKPTLVLSFGQTCGRDSCFDLISKAVKKADIEGTALDIVMLQTDATMTKSEARPRLVEWDLFFASLANPKKDNVRFVFLCEKPKTEEYFGRFFEDRIISIAPPHDKLFLKKARDDLDQNPWKNNIAERFREIVERCNYIWLASFMNAVMEEIDRICNGRDANSETGTSAPQKPEGSVSEDWVSSTLAKIEHTLNVNQDPKQRVTAVIDVALMQMEHLINKLGGSDERIERVLSHAILKHLFAFGGPVGQSVFAECPEIQIIFEAYGIEGSPEQKEYIENSIKWLQRMDLITTLHYFYEDENAYRFGLHGHVRNYLSVKKGLPFSMVMGREQTSVTLLPIIDEEVVPLQEQDYEFVWKACDKLLSKEQPDSACIRAAFMLLRGSMRVGTVLRSHDHPSQNAKPHSPLDRYFLSLLRIREKALAYADAKLLGKPEASLPPPLSAREWIWLINEMGVVRLLQGNTLDSSAFFECAIDMEQKRIDSRNGYEWTRRPENDPIKDFTITKLRILFNLAVSEIERGAFNRAERILGSEDAGLEAVQEELNRSMRALAPAAQKSGTDEPSDKGRESHADSGSAKHAEVLPHREIRILRLVSGMVRARLDYLSGASGKASEWLVKMKDAIVAEGVHGLTAHYYLVRSDIEISGRNFEEAEKHLLTARSEAEASSRSDLILSVMLAESQCQIRRDAHRTGTSVHQHLSRIHGIRREAKRMGMLRVLISASLSRARLYMSVGEYRSARHDLMSALALAVANGLSIKRVSGLVELAALVGSLSTQMRKEASDIAEAARSEAERIGYKLAAMRASELLIVLRENGSIQNWAAGGAGIDLVEAHARD